MTGLDFGAPLFRWLTLACVIVLAVAFALDFTRRRHALERMGHVPQLLRMMASLSHERRILKAILLTAGVSLAVASLSRPQVEGESRWQQRGIDVAVVMDFSKSMLARDVYPNRYQRVEREVDQLLRSLEGDRVALVAFAGAAAHFPLTHDHDAARLLYEGLTPLDMPPGSDIGEAVLRARCIVRPDLIGEPGCERVGGRGHGGNPLDGSAVGDMGELSTDRAGVDRARAIVIFTDGEDTEGRARAEIEKAVEQGVEVFVVGVGTTEGELIPEFDQDGNEVGWKKTDDGRSFVTTRLEEGALRELAVVAGGEDRYYRLDPKRVRSDELVGALQKLKKGDLDERVVKIPREVYQWLLFPAFMLLLIEACLSDRRRPTRRDEEALR